MSAVVSPDLKSRFESHSEEPAHREQVLVTKEGHVNRDALTEAGFDVQFVTRDGTIATGSLDRAALNRLAQLPGVVAIEPDTQMHALDAEPTTK